MKGRAILISVLALGLMLALAVGLTQAQGPGARGEVGVKAAPVGTTASAPLSTSFTYQGRLTDGGGPANGSYDFQFRLYDAASGGAWVGTIPKDDVTVSDGLFMVELDFGSAFTGDARWLEIGVRPGASAGAYTTLTPRQALTATPYALYALGAPWSGLAGIPPDFADGVDDDTLGGLSCSNGQVAKWNSTSSQWQCGNDETSAGGGWSLTGNAGTNPATNFLGTTDNVALELRVNNARALRLEPNVDSPNLIGGYSGNSVTNGVVGATIGGGGQSGAPNRIMADYGTIGGGKDNQVSGERATIGGGGHNTASGDNAAIGGGWDNVASEYAATVGGGANNRAYGTGATIGGGYSNHADAENATVGGGEFISVAGRAATVAGGSWITITNQYAAVGGGQHNIASGDYATVGGGGYNIASGFGAVIAGGGGFDPFWSSIDGNTASGKSSTVGGGINNTASGAWGTIGGGQANTVSNQSATVGGGTGNTASEAYATVGGGNGNIASGEDSTVGGGDTNEASGEEATVGGGRANEASGVDATIAGGELNVASSNHASVGGGLWNTASGEYATVGGGYLNHADALTVTIGGGEYINVTDRAATVAGGSHITVTSEYAAVGGGLHNTVSGPYATIGGGEFNIASGYDATVGGGNWNEANGDGATVGGGDSNIAGGDRATVGGGSVNTASGHYATVPGGNGNTAQGNGSFAAGYRAKANHDGTFVWADSTDADFESTAADQFAVRANGGALITGANDAPMLTATNLGGGDGLRVNKSGDDGLQIGDGTNFPSYGVFIPLPGVPNNALYVQTANANGEWALSTLDKISAANVTFSSLTLVAVVDGPDSLTPGDLVAASGLADPLPDTLIPLPRVRLADGKTWNGVIGVVESLMVLQPMPGKADKDGNAPLELHSVPGPAKAGDYVALTVFGVAHVKADATAGDIVPGQRLTAASRSGHVRALRTRMLEGMMVTEGAPVIGIALAPLDKDSGTIPVLVTLQ